MDGGGFLFNCYIVYEEGDGMSHACGDGVLLSFSCKKLVLSMIGWGGGRGEAEHFEIFLSLCIWLLFFLGEGLNHDDVWERGFWDLFGD